MTCIGKAAAGYGAYGESNDDGKGAYIALLEGGASQCNAVLSGEREPNGNFDDLEAHGFYWIGTELNDSIAWFDNLGKGRPALYLQNDGVKSWGFAVRYAK